MDTFFKFLIVSLIAFFVAFSVFSFNVYRKHSTDSFCVTDKDIKAGSKSSRYLIFADKEVFEITDSLLNMRWNSSDLYSEVQIGKCYNAKLQGERVPFLSMYRNILVLQEVRKGKK